MNWKSNVEGLQVAEQAHIAIRGEILRVTAVQAASRGHAEWTQM